MGIMPVGLDFPVLDPGPAAIPGPRPARRRRRDRRMESRPLTTDDGAFGP